MRFCCASEMSANKRWSDTLRPNTHETAFFHSLYPPKNRRKQRSIAYKSIVMIKHLRRAGERRKIFSATRRGRKNNKTVSLKRMTGPVELPERVCRRSTGGRESATIKFPLKTQPRSVRFSFALFSQPLVEHFPSAFSSSLLLCGAVAGARPKDIKRMTFAQRISVSSEISCR